MLRLQRRLAAGLIRGLTVLAMAAHLAGCAPEPPRDFAIYLPAVDMTVAQMSAAELQTLALQDASVLSTADIVYLRWGTQELKLTDAAFQRIMAMRVPVRGLPFVACVDRKPVYWGAFWTPISSMSFDGVTIVLPLGARDNTIQIELGYPGSDFFRGQDPRFDAEVRKALERAGKLR